MAEPLRLLIIEDSNIDFLLITRQLRQAGYDVVAERVESEDALNHALDTARWDVLLCDVQLPRLSAVYALQALKRRDLDIPFIVVSGTIGEEAAVLLMKEGAHDFFVKGRLARLPIAITRELREAEHRRERRAAEKALQLKALQQTAVTEFGLKALQTTHIQTLCDEAVALITGVLNVDLVRLLELKPDGTTFTVCAVAGGLASIAPAALESAVQNPQAAYALATMEPLIVRDYASEGRFTPHASVNALGLTSAITVVVQGRERRFGVLSAFSKAKREFSDDEINFVQSIANVLSHAIRSVASFDVEARARAAAERADQLKTEFLRLISHEFRTPLTSIKGFLSTLLADDIEWDVNAQRQFIAIANEETDYLASLIEQLIDLTQINAGTFSVTRQAQRLRPLVDDVIERIAQPDDMDRFQIDIPADLPMIHADPRRIQQVLQNLMSNAMKYSPPHSAIRVAAHADGNAVQVDVADEGQGIAPDSRRAVFDAFNRGAHSNGGATRGVGMGLAVSRGIVEAHDGKIWVQELPLPGTTISFTLPLASAN